MVFIRYRKGHISYQCMWFLFCGHMNQFKFENILILKYYYCTVFINLYKWALKFGILFLLLITSMADLVTEKVEDFDLLETFHLMFPGVPQSRRRGLFNCKLFKSVFQFRSCFKRTSILIN